jgi:hypothetical protein
MPEDHLEGGVGDLAEDEEYETAADQHRMAAHHFAAAAKHHLAAAEADDAGNDEANARHAYLAYRHQLNAVQYAEIAVMDNESLEDSLDDAMDALPGDAESGTAADEAAKR